MSKITEKMIEKFCESIKITESMIKLCQTSKVDEINSVEMQKILINLYSSKQAPTKIIASMLNAMFTQEATVFITSKISCGYLAKRDPNIDFVSFRSPVYKKAMATLIENEVIKMLEPPRNRKAGLYQVIDPMLLAIIDEVVGKKFRNKKEEKVKEWFFSKSVLKNEEEKSVKKKMSVKEVLEKMREDLEIDRKRKNG